MKVSPLLAFIAACVLGLATIAGIVILDVNHITDPTFLGIAGSIVTSLTAFGGIFRQQNTINAKVNGNLSKLIDTAVANASTPAQVADAHDIAKAVGIEPNVTPGMVTGPVQPTDGNVP